MSLLNHIPIVAHVKAGVQALTGDSEGANRTMESFHLHTPGVSHMVAGVAKLCGEDKLAKEALRGGNDSINAIPVAGHVKGVLHLLADDEEGAERAIKRANQTADGMLNSTPGVGHAKGLIHLAVGDKEGCKRAMLASTRTTAVMGAGAVGFLAAGPGGAVALGIESGALWDTTTAIATDGKEMNGIMKIAENPTNVESYFDAGMAVVGDGLAGYAGGKVAERVVKASEIRTAERLQKIREEKGFAADGKVKNGAEVYSEVKDLKTGKTYDGVNKNVRGKYGDPGPVDNKFVSHQKTKGIDPHHHGRSANTCAEAQAMHKKFVENPNGQVRMNTLEVREDGSIYNKPRCENCQELVTKNDGYINTDYAPERVPGVNEYAKRGGAAVAAAGVCVGRMKKSS